LGFLALMKTCAPIGSYRVVELNSGACVVQEKCGTYRWVERAVFHYGAESAAAACKWIEDMEHEKWLAKKKRVIDCFDVVE